MGFGRVIAAAAAAAAPAVREQLRRVYSGEDRDAREHTLSTAASGLPRSTSDSSLESDRYAEDMARRPLIAVDTHGPLRPSQSYGTISGESPSTLRASPERYRRDSWLDRVPEETTVDGEQEIADQERDEWDLAEYGYYSGEFLPSLLMAVVVVWCGRCTRGQNVRSAKASRTYGKSRRASCESYGLRRNRAAIRTVGRPSPISTRFRYHIPTVNRLRMAE